MHFFYLKSNQARTNFIFVIDKLTIMTQGYVHFLLMKNTKNYGKKMMTEPWYRIWRNEQALWPMWFITIKVIPTVSVSEENIDNYILILISYMALTCHICSKLICIGKMRKSYCLFILFWWCLYWVYIIHT